jgi:hypothetical protein
MTSRVLPRDEWPRLVGTEAGEIWPHLPEGSLPVVVEHDGAIVGCHVLIPYWHVECLWIAPNARGRGAVARRLWAAVRETARFMHVRTAFTAALDDRVRGLLEHVGAMKLPGDHYCVPLMRE